MGGQVGQKRVQKIGYPLWMAPQVIHDIALITVQPHFEKNLLKADRPLEIPLHGKMVVALHSFKSIDKNDLKLVEGEEYQVLDDSQPGRTTYRELQRSL